MTRKEALAILMEDAVTFYRADEYPTIMILNAVEVCQQWYNELEDDDGV